jgi:hypothetical protein
MRCSSNEEFRCRLRGLSDWSAPFVVAFLLSRLEIAAAHLICSALIATQVFDADSRLLDFGNHVVV